MEKVTKVFVNFFMNNSIEVLCIGTAAYIVAGIIMRLMDFYFGFWFGKKGGFRLWFVIALIISGVYHLNM